MTRTLHLETPRPGDYVITPASPAGSTHAEGWLVKRALPAADAGSTGWEIIRREKYIIDAVAAASSRAARDGVRAWRHREGALVPIEGETSGPGGVPIGHQAPDGPLDV